MINMYKGISQNNTLKNVLRRQALHKGKVNQTCNDKNCECSPAFGTFQTSMYIYKHKNVDFAGQNIRKTSRVVKLNTLKEYNKT